MHPQEAIALIQPAIPKTHGIWADLGAGTGTFTSALMDLLPAGSTVYAVDKSPHFLWKLTSPDQIDLKIEEADFTRGLNLPLLDGVLMANALHYAQDHRKTLLNVMQVLKPQGIFILIEYNVDRPLPPWIPYPISRQYFGTLCSEIGLESLTDLHSLPSRFGHKEIYAVKAIKK